MKDKPLPMPRTILVTGATGAVSGALLTTLKDSGHTIRALVRDPARAASSVPSATEVAVGDLGDPRSLPAAFAGVHDLWLLVANGPLAPEHSANAVWAARQAGVERVVRLSAVGAAHDAPTRGARLHALSDRELRESGMRWTILRPLWFMQNLLGAAGEVSARRTLSLAVGAGRLSMIDVRDVAAFAARVLCDEPDAHHGKTYTLSGPRSLSPAEVGRRLTTILGAPVAYEAVSGAARRATLLGHGVPPWITDMIVEYEEAYATGWGDFVTTDFPDVVGHAPRDVDDFLRDHVAAFSGARADAAG